MASRLLNVRLDDVRVGKARRLRQRGLSLSDVVREAIDARYEMLAPRPGESGARLDAILNRYPDPPDVPARPYDVHDRRAAKTAIIRALKRRTR